MARNGVQFNMWLSQDEKAKIQEKANKAGISMSEYIRCSDSLRVSEACPISWCKPLFLELN